MKFPPSTGRATVADHSYTLLFITCFVLLHFLGMVLGLYLSCVLLNSLRFGFLLFILSTSINFSTNFPSLRQAALTFMLIPCVFVCVCVSVCMSLSSLVLFLLI